MLARDLQRPRLSNITKSRRVIQDTGLKKRKGKKKVHGFVSMPDAKMPRAFVGEALVGTKLLKYELTIYRNQGQQTT